MANTINSVINQTYDNWELIILDDESTDNSKKIIEEYASKNNKIKSYPIIASILKYSRHILSNN